MDIEITAEWAFNRYQEILKRLPSVSFSNVSLSISDLSEIDNQFDVFVFDAFGVLNIGEAAVDGAAAVLKSLRLKGKSIFLLTNSASQPKQKIRDKYSAFGFDFASDEIVTSRDILISELGDYNPEMCWGVIAPQSSSYDELPCHAVPVDIKNITTVDGFIFLGISEWKDDVHQALIRALRERPRPVLIGNPDLVGPRESSFSRQPGYYAHDIWDRTGIVPQFFGKPYANAFDLVRHRLGTEFNGKRVLMIGDTLHTDILGAAAAGFSTALVTGHGVLRGLDIQSCIDASGICPDFILPKI